MKATVEWIPCATRLPDDDERVLVVHEGDVYVGWYDSVRDDGGWISDDGCPLEYEVTHWATFPEVPGDACAAEPASEGRAPWWSPDWRCGCGKTHADCASGPCPPRAANQPSASRPVCRICGQFLDSRGTCRIPEHNA